MSLLANILEHNREFVQEKKYVEYQTTKFPNKKLVILSCMDTRLTYLLPQAMNIKNGDTKIIKNAGAIVSHPFGSVMRSLVVAIYELGAKEVCVVGHHGCGMGGIRPEETIDKMLNQGISSITIDTLERAGIDIHGWLKGFSSVEESIKESVTLIRQHPLIPKEIPVHGMVIDPETGKLDVVTSGYGSNE
ncbi:beta-class carbonic anhydrase [Marininema halotolerans]|uniref:carbonic anhydrase n=1 Tax=Marininema halotolerans TaxID=1155944 RepID=A0A1I6S108_9BACL|nr:carbonic anhydrase [Marininema halotolerans]SFS70617.1 carbonic anhydrase [Marininema halotolerans]